MEFERTTVITMLYAKILMVHLIALVIQGTQAMALIVKVSSAYFMQITPSKLANKLAYQRGRRRPNDIKLWFILIYENNKPEQTDIQFYYIANCWI